MTYSSQVWVVIRGKEGKAVIRPTCCSPVGPVLSVLCSKGDFAIVESEVMRLLLEKSCPGKGATLTVGSPNSPLEVSGAG